MNLKKAQCLALYLFLFSINFEVFNPFGSSGSFSVSKLTGIIYLLTIIPHYKEFISISHIKSVLTPLWIFFGILTIISLININSVSSSFFDFSIFQNIIMMLILINHNQKVPNILNKGLLSFAIGSIALSIFYYFGIGVEYSTEGRVMLFKDNENTVGMRMSISIIILLFNIFQNPLNIGKSRFFILASFPLMVKLLTESGSRIAFLTLVVMFSIGTFLFKTEKKIYKLFVVLLSGILIFLIIQYVFSNEVFMTRILLTTESGDIAGRDIIWQKLFPLIIENPFFGVGKTGYVEYSQQVFNFVQSPHNVIFEILCYTGFVGLFSYLLFVFRSAIISIKAYKYRHEFLPLLLFIPIAGYLLSGQILNNKIGWVIFAFAIAEGTFIRLNQKRYN